MTFLADDEGKVETTTTHTWGTTRALWEKSTLHCVNCGAQAVWIGEDEDYYEGPTHLCASCGTDFHLSRIIEPEDSRWAEACTKLKAAEALICAPAL